MSKLLKATIASHRPHIAARMTAENGYDATKHLHTKDLTKAGLINQAEQDDLDGCVDDLAASGHQGAGYINAAKAGMVGDTGLNDDALIKELLGELAPNGDTMATDGDSGEGIGNSEDADDKVTA